MKNTTQLIKLTLNALVAPAYPWIKSFDVQRLNQLNNNYRITVHYYNDPEYEGHDRLNSDIYCALQSYCNIRLDKQFGLHWKMV